MGLFGGDKSPEVKKWEREVKDLDRAVGKLGNAGMSQRAQSDYRNAIRGLRHARQQLAAAEGRQYGDTRWKPRGR
jgi:exonuclease VII small subunit